MLHNRVGRPALAPVVPDLRRDEFGRIPSLARRLIMAVPQGIVRVHQHAHTVLFQVDGWTTMNQSLSFRRFGEQCLAAGATALRVDLRRCTFMDSTFMGTLLFLKRAVHKKENGEFTLLSPSAQCRKLIKQMGVEGVFPIEDTEEPAGCPWCELPSDGKDHPAFKQNVLQAHQELADLEGPSGGPFRAVVQCLTEEMEAEQEKAGRGKP
jgi:anti-anti-sigma factor